MTNLAAKKMRLLVCAFVLALACCAAPATTHADESSDTQQSFPSIFDLRVASSDATDGKLVNYVSPVKLQNPWGTCWAFTALSAAEISIATSSGTTYLSTNDEGELQNSLDLSERALAWFAENPIERENANYSAQVGEGINVEGAEPLAAGGRVFWAAALFAQGSGPLLESDVPYQNDEGYIEYDYSGDPLNYSEEGDWSVSESKRFTSNFRLEDANILESPATVDEYGYYQYNSNATKAIKSEISAGRGVAISFCTDQDLDEDATAESSGYLNIEDDTWAQYAYSTSGKLLDSNHAGCIVGWDDSYSRSNFIDGSEPPGDGAWIVKNNWGSGDADFPNTSPSSGGWGVDGSGYFYLSYYDMSLADPISFVFEQTENGEAAYSIVHQYDFIPAWTVSSDPYDDKMSMANVFSVSQNEAISALSVQTPVENTQVNVQVYKLSDDATSPSDGSLVVDASVSIEHAGYHRLELSDAIYFAAGDKFAVVVNEQDESGTYYLVANSDVGKNNEDVEDEEGVAMYATSVVNAGESFVKLGDDNDGWTDWTSSIEATVGDREEYVIDNLPIKAYASPVDEIPASAASANYAQGGASNEAPINGLAIFGIVGGVILIVIIVGATIAIAQIRRKW